MEHNPKDNRLPTSENKWSYKPTEPKLPTSLLSEMTSHKFKPRRISGSKSDNRKSILPDDSHPTGLPNYINAAFDEHDIDLEKGDDEVFSSRSSTSQSQIYDSINPEPISNPREHLKTNKYFKCVHSIQSGVDKFWKHFGKAIILTIEILIFIAFNVYVGYVIYLDWKRAQVLFILLILIYSGTFYFNVVKPVGKLCLGLLCENIGKDKCCTKISIIIKWILYLGILAAIVTIPVLEVASNPEQLISGVGLIAYILLAFVFSKHPAHVKWRTVYLGVAMQFFFGLIILRWNIGKITFQWVGDQINTFLSFTDAGSKFVYGEAYLDHQFAFSVMSVVIFFSFCTSLAYYWGAVPFVVRKLGWLLQMVMGTTAAESMNAAANIFVGMTEAPLLIRPHLPVMTKSEIHAVMTGGFATIAGSVMAAYISMGVSASHLLSASVMSAPAALAVSKLFYPETEESQTTVDNIKIVKGTERNALEAAVKGASNAIPLVANIGANLIAFLAFIKGVNVLLHWFGSLAGFEELSFEFICSYIFMPFAYLMGIPWDECNRVGQLIGIKTIVNEFVAYQQFVEMKALKPFTERAEIITTYVLCGFSNLSSIGITVGALSAMAPERTADISDIAFRALIAGCITCFMTGCIAGLITVEAA